MAFEPEVYALIQKHTVITNFKSEVHARHRLVNMVYKFIRKRNTDNGMPDDLAKKAASETSKRAAAEWSNRLIE